MEIGEVLTLIKKLVDGRDPETGQPLPDNAVCKQPQTIAALQATATILENARDREQRKRTQPPNSGKYWSQAEDERVCDELRKGMNFHEIAAVHNRSVGLLRGW